MSVKERVPVTLRRSIKIARARAAEFIGSDRYSKPAINHLDEQMIGRLPATGIFLEIGANDGYSQSNTYFLERRRGWTGILIEPQPKLYGMCRRVRPGSQCFNYACVADKGVTEVELAQNSNDLCAVTLGQQETTDESPRIRGGRTFLVPATTISQIIDDAGSPSIDFMSIDVEGAELAVLGGLDWERHTPGYLLVETDYPERVDEALGKRMTRSALLSNHDYLWERNAGYRP